MTEPATVATTRGTAITPLEHESSGCTAVVSEGSFSTSSAVSAIRLGSETPVYEPTSPVSQTQISEFETDADADEPEASKPVKAENSFIRRGQGSSASLRLDTILRQQFEDEGHESEANDDSKAAKFFQSFTSESALRVITQRFLDSKAFQGFFVLLTLFALFGADIDLMVGDKESSFIVALVSTLVFGFFGFEIIINSLAKKNYALRSSIFWLDVTALISLLPDTLFLKEFAATNALMAGRSSRLTRIIRLASRSSKATRLYRLTRLGAALPRLAAGFNRESSISEREVESLLEKKLRRIFTYVDDDMDGAINHESVDLVIARIKIQDQKHKSIMSSRLSSGTGSCFSKPRLEKFFAKYAKRQKSGEPKPSNSPELTPRSEPTTPRRVTFVLDESRVAEKEDGPPDEQATPSASVLQRSNSFNSGFESEVTSEEAGTSFEEFKTLILADKDISDSLNMACRTQIQKTANMQSLGMMHVEDVGVKVALNVIFLLLVLSFLTPSIYDNADRLALSHTDAQARLKFWNWSQTTMPVELQEPVLHWQDHLSSAEIRSQLLYLDINGRVVCDILDQEEPRPCLTEVDPSWYWPDRSSLEHINWLVKNAAYRMEDMILLQLPDGDRLSEEASPEELNEEVRAVAVLDIRSFKQQVALESFMTTCFVLCIILGGIVALTKDLGGFSKNLLKPIRSLADEMQSIATMQLAALNQDDQKIVLTGVAEVRLIQNIFEKTKTAIRSWGKYVPWPVVQQLLAAGIDAEQGVSEKEVTMFFSDIASFTTIVEKLPPERSLILLSRYFNDMSSVIDSQQGIVIEFIGDAILSVFGAPSKNKDHAEAAIRATLKMLKALDRMNSWSVAHGLPKVSIRCGVHTGEVLVGNMGFHSRMKYGIVGENANIPARLEELNKNYGTNNLVSKATYRKLPHDVYLTRVVDYIYLRKDADLKVEPVYQVLGKISKDGGKQRMEDMVSRYETALQSYKNKNFELAVKQFEKASKKTKSELGLEDKAATLMHSRALAYSKNPPPPTWDGVWDGPES